VDLSDSLISRTSDRSGVSEGVTASKGEVSDNGELEEPVQLVAKKNITFKVWKYFSFVADEDGNPIDSTTPKCNLCFKGV